MNSATVKSATVKDVKWKCEMEDENEEGRIENRKSKDPLLMTPPPTMAIQHSKSTKEPWDGVQKLVRNNMRKTIVVPVLQHVVPDVNNSCKATIVLQSNP
eukprot:4877396-Ditylum_brightwellii.AAC.1